LVGTKGGWALITDEYGQAWVAAAERLSAKYGIPINTAQVGQSPEMKDRDGQWEQVKQLKKGGAVLVRPDNFVAWRARRGTDGSGKELESAFETLLGFKDLAVNGH
jgi:2,4-dichlorophenol 6-monooxygenase